MSDTQNVTMPGQGTGNLWSAAGGALVGSLIGNNGILGGGGGSGGVSNAVSLEQMQGALNNLQGQMNTDAVQGHLGRIQDQICDSSANTNHNISHSVGSVKDAVVSSGAATQLALCNLGHNMQAGFAQLQNSIVVQGYESRLLATQQQLDNERAKATEYRIELTEHKNNTGHQATQFMVQQALTVGK